MIRIRADADGFWGDALLKIAVIGSGVTGLGTAWLLGKKHDVTIFEAEDRIGGHANTFMVEEATRSCPVDTGFIVYNIASYPNLIALFHQLDVPTAPTDMSFSVSMDRGAYEYNGNGLSGLFGQASNLFSAKHWRMTRDVLRFFRETQALDVDAIDPDLSLGDWLAEKNYSKEFVSRHILPMGAAIWSTPAREMMRFPFASFVRFFSNHGLLQLSNRPQWRTVVGGSKEYVMRVLADFGGKVRQNDAVVGVVRDADAARVKTKSGYCEDFDAVVMACHADEALACLERPSDEEQNLLSNFSYAQNHAVLHTDVDQLPKRRKLWTSWNYLSHGEDDDQRLAVTYWMNCLQPLLTSHDYFVTLNPIQPVAPEHIIQEFSYSHPMFDRAAMTAQKDLWSLQGKNRTWFAGSYFGYGFHEDGLQSGLAVAEDLGGLARPWDVANARGRVLASGAHKKSSFDHAQSKSESPPTQRQPEPAVAGAS